MIEELKLNNLIVGTKQSMRALEEKRIRKAFLAKDADKNIIGEFLKKCNENNINTEYVESMKELGKACGIEVGAAIAVIVKD